MTIGYSVNSSIDIPDLQQKKSSIDCLFHLILFLDTAEMAKYAFFAICGPLYCSLQEYSINHYSSLVKHDWTWISKLKCFLSQLLVNLWKQQLLWTCWPVKSKLDS